MNGFNFFDKIFYINLDKRIDRLEACKGELNKVGVIAERQPGIIYDGFEDKHRNACIGNHLAQINGGFSTHAYCVRSNLFDLLIDINSDKTITHNDVTYTNDVIPNYNVYIPIPLLAGQRKDFSDIQGVIMDSNPMFIQRFKD